MKPSARDVAAEAARTFAHVPALVAAIGVLAVCIAMLNRLSVWFSPIVFVGSVVGFVIAAIVASRREKEQRAREAGVDYARLASLQLDKALPWLKDNLRGHDAVVESIHAEIKRNLLLARPGRTLGCFMLVGPTGTGKTFLSQLLGCALYPDSEPVIINMNQFKQPGDVFTLIGPPPGMPGCDVGGRLTRPVLENPYRVVILDEIEKAHHDMHDCLYNILDTATCYEKSSGKPVDFSACVFFATCNAGVEKLRALSVPEVSAAAWLGRSRDALAQSAGFDKAFLSRWDGVFLMDQLSPMHVAEVACLQLVRYWREYGIEVDYAAPEVILDAVRGNVDFAEYGVRQLGRYIQEKTKPAIVDAKARGVARVRLDVAGDTRDLTIEMEP